jgi:hypothetical protein
MERKRVEKEAVTPFPQVGNATLLSGLVLSVVP